MSTSNQRRKQTFGATRVERYLPMHVFMRGPLLSPIPSPSD